jgi:hypothetical protein
VAKHSWNFEDAEYLERCWLLLADIYIQGQLILWALKGIVQPFELGGKTRLIQSAVINWRPDKFLKQILMIQFHERSLKVYSSHLNWGARLYSFALLLNTRCPASFKKIF